MPAGSVKGTVLETDDLDGDVTALRSRGVVIDAGIQEAPWGRFVTFDDPDGNGLILQATAAAPPRRRLRPAMPGPDVFDAIASPVRRALLDELAGGRPVGARPGGAVPDEPPGRVPASAGAA